MENQSLKLSIYEQRLLVSVKHSNFGSRSHSVADWRHRKESRCARAARHESAVDYWPRERPVRPVSGQNGSVNLESKTVTQARDILKGHDQNHEDSTKASLIQALNK